MPAVDSQAPYRLDHAPVLVDVQDRIRADEQHDITVIDDVATSLEVALFRRAFAAQRTAVCPCAAVITGDALCRQHLHVVSRDCRALVDVDARAALVIGSCGGAGVAVQTIGVRIGPRGQINALVARHKVHRIALDPRPVAQRDVGSLVDVDLGARVRVGDRRRRVRLGLGTRLHCGDGRLEIDVRALETSVLLHERQRCASDGKACFGVGTGPETGGVRIRIGVQVERAARLGKQVTFGRHHDALADVDLGCVVEIAGRRGGAEAREATAAGLRQYSGILPRGGMDRDVTAGVDLGVIAERDCARRAHADFGSGRTDRHQAAAAVRRSRRGIADRGRVDDQVGHGQSRARPHIDGDRGTRRRVGIRAAHLHYSAARTAGRRGDDTVARRRARERACAAHALEELCAAALRSDVDRELLLARAHRGQIHAFGAEAIRAGERRAADGIGRRKVEVLTESVLQLERRRGAV